MKNLSWFNKIMFFLNIVLTVLTFSIYVLPFLAPKSFPLLSVLTLFMPAFFVANILFFVYWGIQFKKRLILSGLVLLTGITFISKFYKFSAKEYVKDEKDFSVMSYNVRLFNVFKWLDRDDIPSNIKAFIDEKDPDILCIQEYSNSAHLDLKVYPHRYIFIDGKKIAGVLIDIETSMNNKYCIIIGMGINTNNDLDSTVFEIRNMEQCNYNITTLKKELNNVEISNNFFLSKLINNINFFLLEIIKNSFNYQSIFSIYKEKIMNSKDKLNYTFNNNGNRFDGEIIDIDPTGSLLVKDRQKNKIIQISSAYSIDLK